MGFNDATFSVEPNLDFTVASGCGSEQDNFLLNKLRVREGAPALCPDEDSEQSGAIIPQIFQPDTPVVDQLEDLSKKTDRKCFPPYVYNLCCRGTVGVPFSMITVPRVWSTAGDCYSSMSLALNSAGADFTFQLLTIW